MDSPHSIALKTEIIIDTEATEEDQVKMLVNNYIISANWCHGLKPMDHKGRYLLLTTHHQLSKVHEWLDDNLKELFTKYIPEFQPFTPIKGYKYPKRGDKLQFSHQLSTYVDQLCSLYTSILEDTNQNGTME